MKQRLGRYIRRKVAALQGREPPLSLTAQRLPQYRIGPHTYGQPEVFYYPNNAELEISDYCSIASDVGIFLGGEHHPEWVSTYPFGALWREHATPLQPRSRGNVVIGSDVWIGRNATIMSGVTVGHGAVIAAKSLIVKDVAPYAIVGGNPAKLIRYRFDEDTIARLLAIAWWDWPADRVRKAADLLQGPDIRAFIDAVEAGKI
jgi:acetyltransferase-like isoleucine patch superfamily enzyme